MAASFITDLDSQLASLNQLKPPGASKGKIASITQLCVNNIQAESNVVQSLYRALKKAPPTHKLGAIYVIDSVVRRWIEQAKAGGQELSIEGRGEPGTYPAAIKRVTELMPALFDDTLKAIPVEQKEKLEGMIRIWEKGNTFPAKMLFDFKSKLTGAASNATAAINGSAGAQTSTGSGQKFAAPVPSRPLYTPVGYPPQYMYDQGLIPMKDVTGPPKAPTTDESQIARQTTQPAASAAGPSDVNSILATLANMAPKPTPQQANLHQAPPAPGQAPPLPANLMALFGQQNGSQGGLASSVPPPAPVYATPQPAQSFQLPPSFSNVPPPPSSIPQQYAQVPALFQVPPSQQQSDPLASLRGILPPNIMNDQQRLIQALRLLQDLQKDGIPMDQWGPVLKAFEDQFPPAPAAGPAGFETYGRGRSRSPERGGRRRASPVYGAYDEGPTRKYDSDEAQGGTDRRYQTRSPVRSQIPVPANGALAYNGNPMQPKFINFDRTLPPNTIKVLSRTLFVGGAVGSQQEIQRLFERFGPVQTCIANSDKRHAFVKMTTRQHALNAKAGIERLQAENDRDTMSIARQTKWGVGFGPRECCDYAKGESIIPIHKLTEADNKWLRTAEYGGTGGQNIEGGMVLEEPDIEIGAGVSSKAMSKRVAPDSGPPSKRQRDDGGGQRRDRRRQNDGPTGYGEDRRSENLRGQQQYQSPAQLPMPTQMEAYGYARPEPVAVATPPAVPGFGFVLPGAGPNQGMYR